MYFQKYLKYYKKIKNLRKNLTGGNDIDENKEEIMFTRFGKKDFHTILIGGINKNTARMLKMYSIQIKDIIKKEKLKNPVFTFHINSGGGDVISGISMYNSIKEIEKNGIDTVSISDGIVASAATFPYLACKTRRSHKNDRFLFHSPYSYSCGKVKVSDFHDEKINIDDTYQMMMDIYTNSTNNKMNKKIVNKEIKNERMTTPDKCIEWGVITDKKLI